VKQQIGLAAEWLRMYEDEGAEACRAVADWIEHLDREAFIRSLARRAGVPTAVARRKLTDADWMARHEIIPLGSK
jgi:hypothetical protein